METEKFSAKRSEIHLIIIILPLMLVMSLLFINPAYGQNNLSSRSNDSPKIILRNTSLVVQPYISGLKIPMTMAFLGKDILVLEKNTGDVRLIRDGKLQPDPVLTLKVSNNTFEEGLLGILAKDSKTVYLHFTDRDSENKLTNLFYRYTWDGSRLADPILLKEIHGGSGFHNGGPMVASANGTVYAVMGDLDTRKGVLQNHPNGPPPDDTSVIFPLESKNPYLAIGIRASFGLAIDPVTGLLWDTEGGGTLGNDEVNLVTPKFNSGWDVVMGPANSSQLSRIPHYDGYTYHDPKFTWQEGVGATGISFIRSPLFKSYQNSVLVGGFHSGILYDLKLNKDRTGFVFEDPSLAADLVLKKGENSTSIIFGTGFGGSAGGITDIKEGQDGLIYVVSPDGTIYRIVPENMAASLGR